MSVLAAFLLRHKALAVGAGNDGRVALVSTDGDFIERAVISCLMMVFTACYGARNALVSVSVLHNFHL